MDKLKSKDVIKYVRRRGLDWFLQTLLEKYSVKAVYAKPGKPPAEIQVIRCDRIPKPYVRSKPTRWMFYRSLIIAGGYPVHKLGWPETGDKISLAGRVFEIVDGFNFFSWIWYERVQPGMRVFVKEIKQ